jgi:hypothetical protein
MTMHLRLVAALIVCGSALLTGAERQISFDGIDSKYELTFDDSRISSAEMQQLACLSPYVWTYCKPFLIGGEATRKDGKEVIDKVLMAPDLQSCIQEPCRRKTDLPDDAFLEYAATNLREGERQVEVLRQEDVPAELQPVKMYLLSTLERSLEKERAVYEYLKSGKPAQARRILCQACGCGAEEESLLSELAHTSDPAKKLTLVRLKWQNTVLQCERRGHRAIYPIAAWERFVKDYSISEHRRPKRIE